MKVKVVFAFMYLWLVQIQAQHWPMGYNSGIHFQSDSVVGFQSNIFTSGAPAIYRNFAASSFQLFKNDSLIIDSIMPFGNNQIGTKYEDLINMTSSPLPVIIVNRKNQILIFSLRPQDNPIVMYLTIYDTLSKDIITKSDFVNYGVSDKVVSCRHANGRDWWVISKIQQTCEYFEILVTPEKIHTVTQPEIGYCHNFGDGYDGYMYFSPNGKYLGRAIRSIGKCVGEICDFNRHSGNVYNPRTKIINNLDGNYITLAIDNTNSKVVFSHYDNRIGNSVTNTYTILEDSLLVLDTLPPIPTFPDSINPRKEMNVQSMIFDNKNRLILASKTVGYNILVDSLRIMPNYISIIDSGKPMKSYLIRGTFCNLPNLPNYELGPDLNPGFSTNLPDTVLCVGQTFTVTDTSWGHFRRMWEWGDGSFSDTLPVKQHWELLGLLDTFRVMNHTFTQPGTYNLTLHIINDSSEFGYMDSTVTKTFVVLPWCQAPVIQVHTDTVCLGAPLTLAAAGDSATYTWTFTNGTSSGTQISHIFSQSGWNVFSLNVNKFGVDTTLVDSVFVKDCISATFQTEMIPFCDSVIVKVYPQVAKGQIDKITAFFQNQSISCLDSCHFTVFENIEENLMLSFENSTDDTSIVKNLKIKLLDCPEFIEIYPNPVSTQLNIHYRLEKPENLRLCNALGQDVLHIHLEGNGIYSVDVNALSRGFYHLRLERHPDKKRGLKERWKLVLE